jgi:hypothetical protein
MLTGITLFFLSLAAASIIWMSIKNGISPMPSSAKVKIPFLDSLPCDIKGTIFELGAGWGTLAFPLALRYPHCKIIAIENSWVPYCFCKLRQWLQPCPNLIFLQKDFFNVSLEKATLVTCYLYPGAMKQLKDKFENELNSEAIVATHTFAIPGWNPFVSFRASDLYHTPIYHYKNPRKQARKPT